MGCGVLERVLVIGVIGGPGCIEHGGNMRRLLAGGIPRVIP